MIGVWHMQIMFFTNFLAKTSLRLCKCRSNFDLTAFIFIIILFGVIRRIRYQSFQVIFYFIVSGVLADFLLSLGVEESGNFELVFVELKFCGYSRYKIVLRMSQFCWIHSLTVLRFKKAGLSDRLRVQL